MIVAIIGQIGSPGEIDPHPLRFRQENNHWDITFHCKTNLPDTLDELASWIPTGLAYDQVGVNRALRVSVADQAAMHETTPTPAPSAAPAPYKGLSFWEVIGIAGLLSLFSGCNHDE